MRIYFILLCLASSLLCFSQDKGLDINFFEKKGADFEEILSIKNTTGHTVNGVKIRIVYKLLDGETIDYKDYVFKDAISNGLSKKYTVRSFDQNQQFSYSKGSDYSKKFYTLFDIEYSIKEIGSNSNKQYSSNDQSAPHNQTPTTTKPSSAQQSKGYAYYGETKISLPKIAGMTECYSNSKIKQKYNYVFNDKNTIYLAFYLPNEIYQWIDIIDEITFDGYFFIYGQENMKNTKGNVDDLDKMAKIMEKSLLEEWDLDEITIKDKPINTGKPILLDSYSPSKKARSFVTLTYLNAGDAEHINLTILNLIIIKGKLITLTYCKDYSGEDSIDKAKSKNDYSVLRLLDENVDLKKQ